jgi:hypothetical protein
MAEKTKADLQIELDAALAQLEELEHGAAPSRPRPLMPSFGLSEGTRLDILEVQNEIARNPKLSKVEMTEPFTGRVIVVTADSYDVSTLEETASDPEAPNPDNNPF